MCARSCSSSHSVIVFSTPRSSAGKPTSSPRTAAKIRCLSVSREHSLLRYWPCLSCSELCEIHWLAAQCPQEAEGLLPPLRRLIKHGVLAGGKEIQPKDSAGLNREEQLEGFDQVGELHLPGVAHEPRRGQHARVADLLRLGAQRKL